MRREYLLLMLMVVAAGEALCPTVCYALAQASDFTPAREYAAPDGTEGSTIGDFNADGILDIATANRWGH